MLLLIISNVETLNGELVFWEIVKGISSWLPCQTHPHQISEKIPPFVMLYIISIYIFISLNVSHTLYNNYCWTVFTNLKHLCQRRQITFSG